MLEGAAVAGDPFDPELAAAAAGTSSAIAMNALDELLALDLVRETDVPRRFRFRHPLVRRSVYERRAAAGGSARTSAAPRRCSSAGRAPRRAPTTSSARHATVTSRPSRRCARRATLPPSGHPRAPRAGTRGAPAARSGATPARSAWSCCSRTRAARRERPVRAQPRRADRMRRDRAGGRRRAARAARGRVRGDRAPARPPHPGPHASRERARELHDPGSPEAVALMLELASDSLLRMEYDEIQEWAARAAADRPWARRLGADRGRTAMQALAAAVGGDPEEARAQCDVTAQRIDGLSDEEVAPRLGSLVHLATAEMYIDRFEASGRHAERALQIGRATGQGELFPLIFPMLGTALWVQGQNRRVRRRSSTTRSTGPHAGELPGAGLAPLQPLVRGDRRRRRRDRAGDCDREHRGREAPRRQPDPGARRVGARDPVARDRQGGGGCGAADRLDRR